MLTNMSPSRRFLIGAAVAFGLYWPCLAVAMLLVPGDPLPAIAGIVFAWAVGASVAGAFRGMLDVGTVTAAFGATSGVSTGVALSIWSSGHYDMSRLAIVLAGLTLSLLVAALLMGMWVILRAGLAIVRPNAGEL